MKLTKRIPAAFENFEESADPSKRSKDSEAMVPYWDKVAAIIGGQQAMIAAGETYLAKMPGENQAQYDFRKSVAKLTNIYADTVETLASKPFAEEIKIDAKAPQAIKDFAENVDGDGNNLTVFGGMVFLAGINDAISWIMIDYPKVPARNIAEAKAQNIRPFWSTVLASNVLEARVERVGGASVLSYIRIMEPAGGGKPERVRVFARDAVTGKIVWRLWQRGTGAEAQKWTIIDDGEITIGVIPLVPFITGKRDGKRFVFTPALQDAVELQITLYRQESALEFAKVMTAFPMLSASGVTPKIDPETGLVVPITVGPQTVLYAPADGAGNVGEWKYVEPTAASLKFLQEDVKETKQDLRELGKQPLSANQAGLTVITTAYAAGKSKTVVGAWGLGLKDTIENCLKITAKWLNLGEIEPTVSIHDDYDNFSEGDFAMVQAMRDSPTRDISRETLWREARRRGILSDEFDEDEEADLLLKEGPPPSELIDPNNEENPPPKTPIKKVPANA